VSLLKVWNVLLIAASLQIMSTGMYKLFIKPDAKQIGPACINSFDDLKHSLPSFSIVVLVAGGWVFCNSLQAWRP
jgi:uncharacterized membrane protein YqhA